MGMVYSGAGAENGGRERSLSALLLVSVAAGFRFRSAAVRVPDVGLADRYLWRRPVRRPLI